MEYFSINKTEDKETIKVTADFGSYHYIYIGSIKKKEHAEEMYKEMQSIQTVVNEGMKEEIRRIKNGN